MPNQLLNGLRSKRFDWNKLLTAMLATVGALWGAWVFFFQEFLRPAVAPVNISLLLEIKRQDKLRLGDGKTQPALLPVLLTVSAKNSSQKILSIRKTFWVANAVSIPDTPDVKAKTCKTPYCEDEVIKDVNRQMSLGSSQLSLDGAVSRYLSLNDAWDVIAFGPLFDVNEIRPNEEIKAQRLVLVPQHLGDDYELLRVKVIIPSYTKRSHLADEDLIRVVGGISHPSKDFVTVSFCQAERSWKKHEMRWFFDKFALPRERIDSASFQEPASKYCPTLMTPEEREKVGAQVFTSSYEIPL